MISRIRFQLVSLLLLLAGSLVARASPLPRNVTVPHNGTTIAKFSSKTSIGVTPALVSTMQLWAEFSSAAYCSVANGWNCGEACKGRTGGTKVIRYFHTD